MKYIILLIGLALSGLYACSGNPIDFVSTEEATITGNSCKLSNVSADIIPTDILSLLPTGSQILLNASGSLQLNNQRFTYSGTSWKTDLPIKWPTTNEEAKIVALYPAYGSYSGENLYKENKLQDILFINDTYPAGHIINFKFKHLFSFLTFYIAPELQKVLQEISLTTPIGISHISPESAEITFETKPHTSSVITNNSEYYSFIIPPHENVSLELTLITNDGTFIKQLNTQTFCTNTQYVCNIKTLENLPGIKTAEDFIAFTKLINKDKSYTGNKTLDDFGETKNGVTTYRLLNDITLTEAECKQLVPIGMASKYAFNDIFDGQGHTIYDFKITNFNGAKWGLFGYVSNNAIIKNTYIEHAYIEFTNAPKEIAILVSYNEGEIKNCIIKNSHILIKSEGNEHAGILTSLSLGNIVNCSIESCSIEGGNSVGMAAGRLEGNIMNSFFVNNEIISYTTYGGGICGECSPTKNPHIINCYSNSNPINKTSKFGAITGDPGSIVTENCFYHYDSDGKYTAYGEEKTDKKDVYSYDDNFMTRIGAHSVLDKLNEWIASNASGYPVYTFYHWTTGNDSIPAIFIKE